MPVYFFDVGEGTRRFYDHAGITLRGIEDVPHETESLLRLLAYEHVDSAKPVVLKAVVRNADGRKVFRATVVAGHGGIVFTGMRS